MARLTHSDRIKMEALLNAGHSVKEIANQLHVHQATIYREYNRGKYMHRNSDYTEEERYSSDLGQQAHDWYITGKGRPLKIKNDIKYIEKLEKKILDEKYSPEAALNALQQEGEQMCISVRTLYRYIDDGIFLKLTNAHLPVKGKAKKKEKQKLESVRDVVPPFMKDRKTFTVQRKAAVLHYGRMTVFLKAREKRWIQE